MAGLSFMAILTIKTFGFFDNDGVHLSTVGYHMYLFTLSEALSAFIHHDDMEVFRMGS